MLVNPNRLSKMWRVLTRAARCAAVMAPVLCTVMNAAPSSAQVASVLHNFNTMADGSFPATNLVQAGDGNFYGTTYEGGVYNDGTLYRVTPDAHFQTIYNFVPQSGDNPSGPLVLGADGAIYGIAAGGPDHNGVVYRITTDGVESVLHSFTSTTGTHPISGLTYNSGDGNFYGVTSSGGASNLGVIFQISQTGTYNVISDLTAGIGVFSHGGLFYNPSDGLLYGTTTTGGTAGLGAIYSITSHGTLTVVQNLDSTTGYNSKFLNSGQLMLAADGNLYGPLNVGGANNQGAIFKIAGGVFSTIYSFQGTAGSAPETRLVQASDGALYGTTSEANEEGNIYRLTLGATPAVTSLYTFTGGSDGNQPGDLTLASNGLLYGPAFEGGPRGFGGIFNITTTGNFFTIQDLNQGFHDGIEPISHVLVAKDGNFYGTTLANSGDGNTSGTLYRLTPQGVISTLYTFSDESLIGIDNVGSLVQGANGTIYGETKTGGVDGGIIYKFTPNSDPTNTPTYLYFFDGPNEATAGIYPQGGLLVGSDGNLYGTNSGGAAANHGTLFKLTPSGTLTPLWNFTNSTGYLCTSSLVQGSDGALYGVLTQGGANGTGTIFKVTTTGSPIWDVPLPSDIKGTISGLTFGADGNLYGVSNTGGANGDGSIFSVTQSGVITTKYSFDTTHAYHPLGVLALATDGSLYGVATTGGPTNLGSLFQYTPSGVTFPVNFNTVPGKYTTTSGVIGTDFLTAMPDGSIIGVAPAGGSTGNGTVYRYGYVPPTVTSFTAASGPIGTLIKITGTNFMNVASVTFNGVPATFTTVSLTSIKANVPANATTGPIVVTTPGGVATSTTNFMVTPAITSFTPNIGPPGTLVTITGTGFTGATSVMFHGLAANFTVTSSTTITATVPANATTGAISVTTPGGSTSSSTVFTAQAPLPTITSFAPASGPPGTSVRINGTNFTGTTFVKFNGFPATTYTVNSASVITVTVPSGASTGNVSVTTPGGTAASATNFTVTPPAPTITSFTPSSGPVGTSVTITGTNFTGATAVKFNGFAATAFSVVSSTSVTATVPAQATTGKISVATPGGTAASATSFTVTPPTPAITSFTPASGPVGTKVTISGTNLTGATAVAINGTAATSVTAVSATTVTTIVAAGTTTGTISVTTPLGTATSTASFTVTIPPAPAITSFSPASGAPGTVVRINGTNFTGATEVDFNGTPATAFTVASATVITATVPDGATTGQLSVLTAGGTATSTATFTVLPAPATITSFTPASGPIGTVVTITGTNFTTASAVKFNGVATTTFSIDSPTQITVTVPAQAGTGPVSVKTSAGTAVSTGTFTVTSN